MPHLIVTAKAALGIQRCRHFLIERDPNAAKHAGQVIDAKLALLRQHPGIGRPVRGRPGFRELVIGFGASGYVALYLHELGEDAVYILAFRHQYEAGY